MLECTELDLVYDSTYQYNLVHTSSLQYEVYQILIQSHRKDYHFFWNFMRNVFSEKLHFLKWSIFGIFWENAFPEIQEIFLSESERSATGLRCRSTCSRTLFWKMHCHGTFTETYYIKYTIQSTGATAIQSKCFKLKSEGDLERSWPPVTRALPVKPTSNAPSILICDSDSESSSSSLRILWQMQVSNRSKLCQVQSYWVTSKTMLSATWAKEKFGTDEKSAEVQQCSHRLSCTFLKSILNIPCCLRARFQPPGQPEFIDIFDDKLIYIKYIIDIFVFTSAIAWQKKAFRKYLDHISEPGCSKFR
jgi:hypothetical protein